MLNSLSAFGSKLSGLGSVKYYFSLCGRKLSGANSACPNCASRDSYVVDRKYIIMELRRCRSCHLLFRAPTDRATEQESFYNDGYSEGFTTKLIPDDELKKLVDSGFSGPNGNYHQYINTLTQLGLSPGSRVFDFGCAWGFGSYQLACAAGFQVEAYEISQRARAYAKEKFGLVVHDSFPPLARNEYVDCFFSAHVLEHVPSVERVIAAAMQLVKPGGLFVAFTPNGNQAVRDRWPQLWHKMWGRAHSNFLDSAFWENRFPDDDWAMTTIKDNGLYRDFRDKGGQRKGVLDEWELLFVLRKADAVPRRL
jgi:2-polyprenyl-3-methyl-5-hydroxy-6-metoxy-1,4-benzoquinol methylase